MPWLILSPFVHSAAVDLQGLPKFLYGRDVHSSQKRASASVTSFDALTTISHSCCEDTEVTSYTSSCSICFPSLFAAQLLSPSSMNLVAAMLPDTIVERLRDLSVVPSSCNIVATPNYDGISDVDQLISNRQHLKDPPVISNTVECVADSASSCDGTFAGTTFLDAARSYHFGRATLDTTMLSPLTMFERLRDISALPCSLSIVTTPNYPAFSNIDQRISNCQQFSDLSVISSTTCHNQSGFGKKISGHTDIVFTPIRQVRTATVYIIENLEDKFPNRASDPTNWQGYSTHDLPEAGSESDLARNFRETCRPFIFKEICALSS